MPIALSHESALEFYRSVRVEPRRYFEVNRAKTLLRTPPDVTFEKTEGPWWLNRPLHVLVTQKNARRTSKNLKSHLWKGDLPKGAVFDTHNEFYVCAPELVFLQIAGSMELLELIKVGYEFCGTYDVSNGKEVRKCRPLTQVARLKSFLAKNKGAPGAKRANRALAYIIDNSASPMETALAMLLSLPYKYGGYGLSNPQLNHPIYMDEDKRRKARSGFYIGDICWPEAKLVIEYDSDKHHVGEARLSKDSKRRGDLSSQGFTTETVTKSQILNRSELEVVVGEIARLTKKQIRYDEQKFPYANSELRRVLFRDIFS